MTATTTDTLYTWSTPNGLKPVLMLEELGVPYELVKIDIGKGHQRTPEHLARNPNGKIPVLVTRVSGEELSLAESAAILIHLAEKHGKLLPADAASRARTIQWVMFQMSAVGPMLGQLGHFARADEKIPYAIERYTNESKRVLGVLDQQLAKNEWLAGDEYTIADVTTFFWARSLARLGLDPAEWPHLLRWVRAIEARPAAQRTLAIHFG